MAIHNLKLNAKYFDDVMYGFKKFEVRFNDRGFQQGDLLNLREWDGEKYTGRELEAYVDYFIDLGEIGLKDWVAMGIEIG